MSSGPPPRRPLDAQLHEALNEFLDAFETVFGTDWPYTLSCLQMPEVFGCQDNFLITDTHDEASDWNHRAHLLATYRELVSRLLRRRLREPARLR